MKTENRDKGSGIFAAILILTIVVEKTMRNKHTAGLLLVLTLICVSSACNSSSGANSNGNGGAANLASKANTNKKTPVPAAASCPEGLALSVADFNDSEEDAERSAAARAYDKPKEALEYVGCRVSVTDTITQVNPTSVVLTHSMRKHKLYCKGNFANETMTKMGEKLAGFRLGADWSKYPDGRFSGKVTQTDEGFFELTECTMDIFLG